jgi:hypothetical protein
MWTKLNHNQNGFVTFIVGLLYKFHPTRCPDLEAVIYGQKERTNCTKLIGSFLNTTEEPPGSLSAVETLNGRLGPSSNSTI